MRLIEGLSDKTQAFKVLLDNGNIVDFVLKYLPTQAGWFLDFTCGDCEVNNIRISNSPNFIREHKNRLSFGIACFSNDGFDPMSQGDFKDGRNTLAILSREEVQQIEDSYEV